jgi:hypothetical protein
MLLEIVTRKDEYLALGTNVELVDVELRGAIEIEVSKGSSRGTNRTVYGSRDRTEITLGQP